MSDDDFAFLDATAQAQLVARGEVAALDLVDAAIARIERHNPSLNAVIHPAFEQAREQARERTGARGPFAGVPMLMKDIGGAEAGRPNYAGMTFLKRAGLVEERDSFFTERLRSAGLISLGRTNTPELALLATTEPESYGATHNPWKLGFSAGGSSGGSAAAVAAGLVPVAHASDGGGSIRGPASMCALVGLKPTRGRCTLGPALGERWSGLSTEFVLTRSVRDTAAMLDACAVQAPGDPYIAVPPARPFVEEVFAQAGRLRIGIMRCGPRDTPVNAANLVALEQTAKHLESLGHIVEEAYPSALDDAQSIMTYVTIVAVNTARALDRAGQLVGQAVTAADVEPLTWALAERARSVTAPQYIETLECLHSFGRGLAAWWEGGMDLLLTPTQAEPPPPHGFLTSTPEEPFRALLRSAPYGAFTLPWNMSGQPAISVPAQFSEEGLPLGVQLVAAYGREDLLLRVASQLEEAAPWAQRQPTLGA